MYALLIVQIHSPCLLLRPAFFDAYVLCILDIAQKQTHNIKCSLIFIFVPSITHLLQQIV